MPLIETTESGLYCPAGDFHIDPWQPVARAIVTHGHADHARWGCDRYLTAEAGGEIVARRVGGRIAQSDDAPFADDEANRNNPRGRRDSGKSAAAREQTLRPPIHTLPYRVPMKIGGAVVSLHPAGHCLGSAQVRVEVDGEVWVVSGDYKSVPDRTCEPFEVVPCDVFISECTFGLPVFRWQAEHLVFDEINAWWRENAIAGRLSVIFAYSLGKAQRVMAGVDPSIGPVFIHGAVQPFCRIYRARGVDLPEFRTAKHFDRRDPEHPRGLVVAPPSVDGSNWMKRFGSAGRVATAFASGWMQMRGTRRRRNVERGFVLSDHDDWPSLLRTIRSTGAAKVLLTHGFTEPLAKYLREHEAIDAGTLRTRFESENQERTT